MSREKAFISILMVLILIVLSGASVWAAPNLQESISGKVKEINIEGDTVLITLETSDETQSVTVRMSLETAIELVLVDDSGAPIVNIGDDVEIPLSADIEVIEEEGEEEGEEEEGEEPLLTEHPVASALAEFFLDRLGLNYDIMGYHEEGMGFGVIAQACWMSLAYDDPASKLPDIIAFKNGDLDFNSIDLPDGTTATNWGQFKKGVLKSGKFQKNVANLGAIMSGRAEPPPDETDGDDLGATSTQGQGKGKKGKGPGGDGPPGKSKGGKKGGGSPAVPPGQEKDKGGGKGNGK